MFEAEIEVIHLRNEVVELPIIPILPDPLISKKPAYSIRRDPKNYQPMLEEDAPRKRSTPDPDVTDYS
ncbi:MAG: hypothetical protein LBE97_02635 [Holosporales bacterium]|nr:hypothetical protein [Holosporales bacterium]